MKTFDESLKQATRGLTSGSADRVCAENQQQYDRRLRQQLGSALISPKVSLSPSLAIRTLRTFVIATPC